MREGYARATSFEHGVAAVHPGKSLRRTRCVVWLCYSILGASYFMRDFTRGHRDYIAYFSPCGAGVPQERRDRRVAWSDCVIAFARCKLLYAGRFILYTDCRTLIFTPRGRATARLKTQDSRAGCVRSVTHARASAVGNLANDYVLV